MANRPETACSKAHGETSVLLNFTDFPSPLYRFIYYRPVARIISISVKQRPIVDAIYDRFTWTPSPLFVHISPRFFFQPLFFLTSVEENYEPGSMNQNTVLHLIIYRVRSCRTKRERERMVTVSSGVYDRGPCLDHDHGIIYRSLTAP